MLGAKPFCIDAVPLEVKLDTTPGYHLGPEVACVFSFLPGIVKLTRPMAQFRGEIFTWPFVMPGLSQKLKLIDVILMQLSLQKLVFSSKGWPSDPKAT